VSDIQRELQAELYSIQDNDFHGAFEAWKKLCDRCICSQGDYFEGNGSQNYYVIAVYVPKETILKEMTAKITM
jgi:hypothetical protein